ncbi:MAG: VWA domain-containing protein [Myxococcales bacterium]|nr:VWA domain-containing protein [Myxococcales bacterium]
MTTSSRAPRAVLRTLSVAAALALCSALPAADASPPRDKEKRHKMAAPAPATSVYDFEMDAVDGAMLNPYAAPSSASMGATPGGAQDIGYARDRIKDGEVPHPNAFTPEGLFSEHDLPLGPGAHAQKCQQTLCVGGEAIASSLLVQPEVGYLAQLGFSSGLDPKTWKRAPLNLVVVVDRSGSMSGQPLELVRASLREVVQRHLRPGDQLAIVGYHSVAHVVLPSTPIRQRRAIDAAIEQLVSEGATALEDGLRLGFKVARDSARGFQGTTRVMLFTDERPNVGRTDAEGFMAMATRASLQGIGLTTVGVSTQFGAELAQKVSSVRGGNLFFFPDAAKMQDKFRDAFDTMVTELAYDLKLTVRPSPGVKIAGVYGIPGSALRWQGDAIELDVATIFLSRKKGAIYLAFAPAGSSSLPTRPLALGASVAHVGLAYEDTAGRQHRQGVALAQVAPERAGLGLRRGRLLVDEVSALKRATELHHENNDQEGAYQLVHSLASRMRHVQDSALHEERDTVLELERTLARLSGHAGEPGPASPVVDRVSGLPQRPAAIQATGGIQRDAVRRIRRSRDRVLYQP